MFWQIQKQHKYNAKSVIIDGLKFSSQLEARFYRYFQDNNIPILETQPRFLLQEAFKHDGQTIRKIEYVCDFLIEYAGYRFYIEAKGMETEAYKLKRKLWLKRYGHEKYLIVAKSLKSLEEQLTSR